MVRLRSSFRQEHHAVVVASDFNLALGILHEETFVISGQRFYAIMREFDLGARSTSLNGFMKHATRKKRFFVHF